MAQIGPIDENSATAIRCAKIVKNFGQKRALNDAALCVTKGSIHALVGENGAGKSTLINIVSGLLKRDAGTLQVCGETVDFTSPLDALRAGIGMVHQHFLLADALTVAENIAMGMRTSPAGWRFDRRRAEEQVAALARETGLQVDPHACVADLPVGMRQRVEILKALFRGARILLLDEPTAVLAPPEIEALFGNLRRLRDAGRTIVIVTHKLDEVFALASEVTVLRRGETVFAGALAGLNPSTLAEKMIGRDMSAPLDISGPSTGATVVELRNIKIPELKLDQLELKAGEILGVCGVEGNGQPELAALIAGTLQKLNSDAAINFKFITNQNWQNPVRARSDAGLAYIPADRHREGLILEMSLSENLNLRAPKTRALAGISLLDEQYMQQDSAERLRSFGVVPPDPSLPAQALSGGNQQKVVLARELHRKPKLILACNPTRGLDLGAAADVHQRLLDCARKDGASVLLISTDLDEVLKLADRLAVLYRGIFKEIGARGVSKETAGRAMVGAA